MSLREDITYLINGKRPSRTGWVRVNCPACETRQGTPDRKFSMGVHLPTGRWHCFRCASRGHVASDGFEHEVDEVEPTPAIEQPEAFFELFDGPGATSHALERARRYVLWRGIPEQVAREVKIGACTRGRMFNRIVVPVLDAHGTWQWYVGRDFTDRAERRYLYPSGGRVGVMFNSAALDIDTDVPLLVVEGCFDALPHWPHAAAFLGKPTEPHFERLLLARRPICVVLDGDAWEEGEAFAWRLALEGVNASAVRLPPATDPNDYGADDLMQAARNSLYA